MTNSLNRSGDRRQFLGGERATSGDSLLIPDETGKQPRPIVRRCNGGDAVVVFWKPLRLHQRLAAAIRAPYEIGVRGRPSVIGLDDRLGSESSLVDGTPTEI